MVEVNCSFLTGSRALGCYFVLNGTFGHRSMYVARESGSVGRLYFSEPLEELSYAVYDWKEDNSIGNVAIPIELFNTSLYYTPVPSTPNNIEDVKPSENNIHSSIN